MTTPYALHMLPQPPVPEGFPFAGMDMADVEYARCAACGVEHQAEWGMTLRCDRLRRHTAYFRLCDECKVALMEFLKTRPDRGPVPLRGYT